MKEVYYYREKVLIPRFRVFETSREHVLKIIAILRKKEEKYVHHLAESSEPSTCVEVRKKS
jgi:hypothetical protein